MNEAISADPGVDGEGRPDAPGDGVQTDRNPTSSHISFYLPELIGGGVQRRTLTLAAELTWCKATGSTPFCVTRGEA